jgi:hypothetical protein
MSATLGVSGWRPAVKEFAPIRARLYGGHLRGHDGSAPIRFTGRDVL